MRIRGKSEQFAVKKIWCLGRNYAEHVKEMKSETSAIPVVFLKPSTAIVEHGEDIVIPKISHEMHHEVELFVAMGRGGKNIPATTALRHVLGYGVALDMTLRDLQNEAKQKGLPWTISKGFDRSCPVSEIIPVEEIDNPHQLTLRCTVNGTVRQDSSTSKMIFSVSRLIEYISSIFTLEAGDIILTGTPEGVGQVKSGDVIEAELVGHTTIIHRVVEQV